MFNNLILLFNVLGLLFFKTFIETESVNVSHNFPESVQIGSEYEIEIKFNKNDIEGFAEFKQMLPAGFNATIIDSKKGSFSYSNGEVKIIWMTLPEEKEFSVKYKINVLSPASGENWVDGTFSFLVENQKTTVNLEKKKIIINATGAIPDNSENELIQKIELANGLNVGAINLPVSCSRLVNSQYKTNQSILVEIEIKNDSITGFAKLEELIPLGFVASPNETQNAVFTFVDQKVKFLWMSFPFEKEFTVSYLLTPKETISDSLIISGFLSFTIAEISKKYTLPVSVILLEQKKAITDSLADKQITNEPVKAASTSEVSASLPVTNETQTSISSSPTNQISEPTISPATFAEAAKQNQEETKSTSPLGRSVEAPSIPDAQKGINFRVQICATHKPVELSYFRDSYKINEEIYAEMHEGWHKFTVNNVDAYSKARDKREELKLNESVKGPFVTAYNNGLRITVQEALMIANQKWVR